MALKRWLDTVPTVNLKLVAFVALTILTFVSDAGMAWAALVWAMHHGGAQLEVPSLVTEIHDAWLIFLAAFGGISLGQFWVKRATYDEGAPDGMRAAERQASLASARAGVVLPPVVSAAAAAAPRPAPAPVVERHEFAYARRAEAASASLSLPPIPRPEPEDGGLAPEGYGEDEAPGTGGGEA